MHSILAAGFHWCPQFPRLSCGSPHPGTALSPVLGQQSLSVQLEAPGLGRALGTLNSGHGQAPSPPHPCLLPVRSRTR